MTEQPQNPYVGPRTFTRQEGNRFFGREREARELLSLVISERLSLFYAQSGAGKSSLINTRLAPQLEEFGFVVLPIGRVSGELPAGVGQVDNIFVFNLMLSLTPEEQDPKRLSHLSLSDFLAGLTNADGEHYIYETETLQLAQAEPFQPSSPSLDRVEGYGGPPHVLIIDQFEEI